MKIHHIPLLALCMLSLSVNGDLLGQGDCSMPWFNFDDNYCGNNLFIDTISNPSNIWQVGEPQKTILNTAYSIPNVIVTDLKTDYTVNDTSTFIIRMNSGGGFEYRHTVEIHGYYWVNSDTLKDYGMIEFSPDRGDTWIDLLSDPNYTEEIYWYPEKPTLTGNSNGWKEFRVSLAGLGSFFNIEVFDTVLYRFTFISDSDSSSLDGLMFDNLSFEDYYEGIEESGYIRLKSTIYPNPASNLLTIDFKNTEKLSYQLAIFDSLGRLVLLMEDLIESQVELNVETRQPGIYYYRLINEEDRKGSWGKFLVDE